MGRILSDIKMVINHNAHHHLILAAITYNTRYSAFRIHLFLLLRDSSLAYIFYYLFSAAQVVCPHGGGAVERGQGAGGRVRGAGVGQGRGPPIQREPETREKGKC